jgi:hypothetical protein
LFIVDPERFVTLPYQEKKESIPPRTGGITSSLKPIAVVENLSSRILGSNREIFLIPLYCGMTEVGSKDAI